MDQAARCLLKLIPLVTVQTTIFFGGQRLAGNVHGDIKYYITDHLHSTGMFVDKAGTAAAIQDDNHFYPGVA
jgi:hypothetical protein